MLLDLSKCHLQWVESVVAVVIHGGKVGNTAMKAKGLLFIVDIT